MFQRTMSYSIYILMLTACLVLHLLSLNIGNVLLFNHLKIKKKQLSIYLMTCGDNSVQNSYPKEEYKTGAQQPRTSKTIRGRFRCNRRVGIFCWLADWFHNKYIYEKQLFNHMYVIRQKAVCLCRGLVQQIFRNSIFCKTILCQKEILCYKWMSAYEILLLCLHQP